MSKDDSNHGKEEDLPDNPDGNTILRLTTEDGKIKNPEKPLATLPPCKIHRVCRPPDITTLQKLKNRLHEIFFPDDPLYVFRNQTPFQKLILGIEYLFPVLTWAPHYTLSLFKSDLIAGLTIASLAVPQGISYAKLANLPPIIGLYSSFVPPIVYAILGSSKHIAISPVSIASLVMGTMLSDQVSFTQQQELYVRLAFTSTLVAGLFQTSLGLLRLGFIIDFLSTATLIGFMAGAAVLVSCQQLKSLLGIIHFTSQMQIVPVIKAIVNSQNEWSIKPVIMGICFLAVLLTAKQISLRKPKLFWISAAAPLTCVVISTLLVWLVKPLHDLSIIGDLPKGVNRISVDMLYFHGPYVNLCIRTGLVVAVLSLTEGIAVGRVFAAKQNYQVDGNKEMMAIGTMNIFGSITSCYITTGSFSRSAVNYDAGGKTAFSNVVMASAVLVTLLFLMPLFHYTPNVVLAVIIISAVIGLIDYEAALKLWKLDKLDFLSCFCSFFGVLFISVQTGLAIAVGVSVFKIILHVTRPLTHMLGNIAGSQIYTSLDRYENVSRVPSFLILSIESPMFFANATYLQERIIRWIREEEERVKNTTEPPLKCVILDMSAVTAIDTSGIDAISNINTKLNAKSLQLVLVNPVGPVMEKLHRSMTVDLFRANGLYLTVAEAIADITYSWMCSP